MKPDLSDISIVVLSYNRRETIERNLASLLVLVERCGCELIIVDNASSDGSGEVIARAVGGIPSARLVANENNLGVAGGRNAGWRVATRDYILNLDDDISVSADDLSALAHMLRQSDGIGVASPSIFDFNTGTLQYGYGDRQIEIANFQGACHLIRRRLAVEVGFNDEGCSFGGEELDLSIRVRSAGCTVSYAPGAAVVHDHKQRREHDSRARRRRWLYNYIRVHHKHFPPRDAWLLSWRYFVGHVVSGARAHGPFFALGLFGPAARGVHAGRAQYRRVPDDVLRFYRSPALRPEFGNVPLWRKARNVVRRFVAKALEGN